MKTKLLQNMYTFGLNKHILKAYAVDSDSDSG